MAGHSQFKNIMFRKGAQDARRAKVFTKLAREITVAAKLGAPEADKNPRLRAAIQAARKENMPKDNIDRAIKKAVGGDEGTFEEVRYEGIGPGNVAVIVEALTDNRNRTAAEVRSIFNKAGGALSSVAFNFQRVGYIAYAAGVGDHDAVLEAAIEAGADDVVSTADAHEIYCEPDELNTVRDALESSLGEPETSRLDWRPLTTVAVDAESAESVLKFIDALEDNDDVQRVAANFDITDDVMERLSA